MSFESWQFSTTHNSPCKVLEEQTLWGQTVVRVWLPNQDTIVRVASNTLCPLNQTLTPEIHTAKITYIATAAKIAEVLEGSSSAADEPILLAPMETNVVPLPHQIHALSRALSGDRIRYLLADEVGLGKTIEAGLILRELKLRGLVRRTLVVAPKGLATQWEAEMQTHFNESFQLIQGDDISAMQRLASNSSGTHTAWSMFDQVIVSIDSVKPLDKRQGWTADRLATYNRTRFEDLVTAGWDLVIVDEAHRLGGSTDQVARYKLGQGLAEAAPYVLLLSATPHQGKSDAFHRLLSLLDEKNFPDIDSVTRDRVAPYVIRTEKRKTVDSKGTPLFKPRRTQMVPIAWEPRHHLQQLLYESVTDYVREGYNQALLSKNAHIGFLMILMQRLVVSSTCAIRTTLERRTLVLRKQNQQFTLDLDGQRNKETNLELDDLYDMDSDTLLDELLSAQSSALKTELEQVEILLETAIQCEQSSPDAKAEVLLEWIYQLQADENDPDLKLLVFTEFVPTQEMLKRFLQERGISVVVLNGSMAMDERKKAQDAFQHTHRVLISTDAGGEGLNLQFAHVVINYDIPWNPMRIEQRIGRVDRIGQTKVVRAINFVFQDSVEFRVREVLEQKLAVIFEEFGVDKAGDVLDSAHAGELFDDVYTSAIINPESIDTSITYTINRIRGEMQSAKESSPVYGISESPDLNTAERLRNHPLPHWLERMTIAYIKSHGGEVYRKKMSWDLKWSDGHFDHHVVFSAQDALRVSGATLLSLENSRIRGLTLNLPQCVPGQPVPCVSLSGLPESLNGFWGLFEIRLQASQYFPSSALRIPTSRQAYLCIFLNDNGKLFLPTAKHIWDTLQTTDVIIHDYLDTQGSTDAYMSLQVVAEQAGQDIFDRLLHVHLTAVLQEEERGKIAFASRRKAIERVGLPEVRQFRLFNCDKDEIEWCNELYGAKQVLPDIRTLLLLRLVNGAQP